MTSERDDGGEDKHESHESDVAQLSTIEARVLGALMEKQLTTPESYPLTLNSLVLACNQKSSREPVMKLGSGEVQATLNELQSRKLVEIEYGSRANRFAQKLSHTLFLPKPEQAVVTIMLLRGPQTLNDLFSRTQRMSSFADVSALEEIANRLCDKTNPVLVHIPRQQGQREDRYMHLLCGQLEVAASVVAEASGMMSSSSFNEGMHSKTKNDLEKRVEILEEQVKTLLKLSGVEEPH